MQISSLKLKLILAFGAISILLIIYSLYTISIINKSANHFSDYREIARSTVILGRVQATVLRIRVAVKDYIKTYSKFDIEEFDYYFGRTDYYLLESKELLKNKNRLEELKKIENNLNLYKENFYRVIDLVNQRNNIVKNKLDKDGKKIEQLLTSVMNTAEKDDDLIASLKTAKGIRTLLLARLYTAKFLITNSDGDLRRVEQEFFNLEAELAEINKNIQNTIRRKQLLTSVKLINEYISNVNLIRNIIVTRNDIINNKLNKIGPSVTEDLEDIKLSLKSKQDFIGPSIKANNERILNSTVTVSGMIVLFALLISIIIIIGIPNSLNKTSEKNQEDK